MMAGVLAFGLAAPARVQARTPPENAVQPWRKGTLAPSFEFGFGYRRDAISLGFGVGLGYYIIDGLSLGLELDDTVSLYSANRRSRHPNLGDEVPTNLVRLTPTVRYVFFRRYRFSPYVEAGIGPTFLNNGHGPLGHWKAGPGVFIGLTGPLFLDVGVVFSGFFPVDRCDSAFDYAPAGADPVGVLDGVCAFDWGPRVGLALAFDVAKNKR
jgi:hypothetical protein